MTEPDNISKFYKGKIEEYEQLHFTLMVTYLQVVVKTSLFVYGISKVVHASVFCKVILTGSDLLPLALMVGRLPAVAMIKQCDCGMWKVAQFSIP